MYSNCSVVSVGGWVLSLVQDGHRSVHYTWPCSVIKRARDQGQGEPVWPSGKALGW